MDALFLLYLAGYGFVVYLLPWFIFWGLVVWLFSALDGR